MKIWAVAIYNDITFLHSKHDFDLFMETHFSRIWEQQTSAPPPATWQEMRAFLSGENIPDDEFPVHNSWSTDEAFSCVYNYADLSSNIEGYDPLLHRAALEEWVKSERRAIEEAMSNVVWADFPYDIETLEQRK